MRKRDGEELGAAGMLELRVLMMGYRVAWRTKTSSKGGFPEQEKEEKCGNGDAARRGRCHERWRRLNRVKHDGAGNFEMDADGLRRTWRFFGCARSLVDDGEVVKTQDTELGRDGWCPRAATSHSIFQHGPCAGQILCHSPQPQVAEGRKKCIR